MSKTSIESKLFRVLCLDGGGAKGFYTLGALKEIEALVGCRLCDRFDLIYGTSTGAIIAALLGLGRSVDEVLALYREHVVAQTDMGIVATRWMEERPIILFSRPSLDKLSPGRPECVKPQVPEHLRGKSLKGCGLFARKKAGHHRTFEPGFGCTIGDAVVGSCYVAKVDCRHVSDRDLLRFAVSCTSHSSFVLSGNILGER